jgi:hypothetical protein
LAHFPRIIEVFTQKIVTKPSKIWVWDPGSGKNLFRIPDPGVKKAPDPGYGSATLFNYLMQIRDPGWKNSDPRWKTFGSGRNIPDPLHWNNRSVCDFVKDPH